MQSVSSRIWTRDAVSISYDNNHYTTGTSYYNGWYAIKPNHKKMINSWLVWFMGQNFTRNLFMILKLRSNRTTDSKIVLDAALLNTQNYKVQIKGKMEQSRERSSAFPDTSVIVIEKRAFGSPSTMVANFTTYI